MGSAKDIIPKDLATVLTLSSVRRPLASPAPPFFALPTLAVHNLQTFQPSNFPTSASQPSNLQTFQPPPSNLLVARRSLVLCLSPRLIPMGEVLWNRNTQTLTLIAQVAVVARSGDLERRESGNASSAPFLSAGRIVVKAAIIVSGPLPRLTRKPSPPRIRRRILRGRYQEPFASAPLPALAPNNE